MYEGAPKPVFPRAPAPKARHSKLRRGLFAALLSVVVMVVGFELVCRVAPPAALTRDVLDPFKADFKNSRVQPHAYLAYAGRPDFKLLEQTPRPLEVVHNSMGFAGLETTWEKPSDVYRIVCLGGSSTYGIGPSSTFKNWPVLLEQQLNSSGLARRVEVINLGLQGYSTFESQINLSLRGVEFRPDLVLVYHTINDLRCALYPGVVRDNTHWRGIWPVDRPDPLLDTLERSFVFLAGRRYLTDWLQTKRDIGTYVIVDFGKYYPDDFAQPSDPDLGFASFRRNLVSIVSIARAHGAEAMLATEAMRMGDFDRFGSRQLQRDGFERMTRIIGEVANERSVPFCDVRTPVEAEADRQRAESLQEALRARAEAERLGTLSEEDAKKEPRGLDRIFVRPEVGNGEVHLTDEGCELVARVFCARIVELGLVK